MHNFPEVEEFLLKTGKWTNVKEISTELGRSISRELDRIMARSLHMRVIVFKYDANGTKVFTHKTLVEEGYLEPAKKTRPIKAKTTPKIKPGNSDTALIDQFVTLIDQNRKYKAVLASILDQLQAVLHE